MIVNVVYGFLGAGKTTFIKYVMERPLKNERTVVMVNEFGEVGVDGLILAEAGDQSSAVVEMPSGCICCTMAADFRRTFLDVHRRFAPDRMIIEPTGVATIAQIVRILEGEDLQPLHSCLHLIHVVDGSEFLSFFTRQRHLVENQLRASTCIILNKADRIQPKMVDVLEGSMRQINPAADVYAASFARLDPVTLAKILGSIEAEAQHDESPVDSEHGMAQDHGHEHGLEGQYDSIGNTFSASFDKGRLHEFFTSLMNQRFGRVVRAKGIFQTPGSWVRMELASNEVRLEPAAPAAHSIVSIIGQDMKKPEIESALNDCRT